MTTFLIIKTTIHNEFDGFIEHVIKSSHEFIQNRFYMHTDINTNECIIILHVINKEIAKYLKLDFEQIKNTKTKIININ